MRICVFCGSSAGGSPVYAGAAFEGSGDGSVAMTLQPATPLARLDSFEERGGFTLPGGTVASDHE